MSEINLVLRRRIGMVGSFYLKTHLLKCHNHFPARVLAGIDRADIKKTALFFCLCCRTAVLREIEQEKLALRSRLYAVSKLPRLLQNLPQYMARIPPKRRAVRPVQIADKTRHLSLLRPPRENLEGVKIRIKIDIRLLHRHKTLNCRTVKHALVPKHLLELACRNRHVFKIAEHIGELEPDKLHILLLHKMDNILLCVMHLFASFTPFKSHSILRIWKFL